MGIVSVYLAEILLELTLGPIILIPAWLQHWQPGSSYGGMSHADHFGDWEYCMTLA